METDAYQLLRFVHVLLFAYWLGADVGVFLAGGLMSRPGLSVAERNRIRGLLMDIDLLPRLALLGMLPVGFQLSLAWGAPLPATWLPAVWGMAFGWIVLTLLIHFRADAALVKRLLLLDLGLRVALLAALLVLSLGLLAGAIADVPAWLAVKLLLFAVIIIDGMVLRIYSGQWRIAMARFAAGDVNGGEMLLKVRRRKAAAAALVMWALVAVIAFLGVTKPA
jgi:hypothetical protein